MSVTHTFTDPFTHKQSCTQTQTQPLAHTHTHTCTSGGMHTRTHNTCTHTHTKAICKLVASASGLKHRCCHSYFGGLSRHDWQSTLPKSSGLVAAYLQPTPNPVLKWRLLPQLSRRLLWIGISCCGNASLFGIIIIIAPQPLLDTCFVFDCRVIMIQGGPHALSVRAWAYASCSSLAYLTSLAAASANWSTVSR